MVLYEGVEWTRILRHIWKRGEATGEGGCHGCVVCCTLIGVVAVASNGDGGVVMLLLVSCARLLSVASTTHVHVPLCYCTLFPHSSPTGGWRVSRPPPSSIRHPHNPHPSPDFFTTAVHARFQFIVLAMICVFIATFLFWAVIYYGIWLYEPRCFLGFHSFLSAFLFSIETQNTIGE